ncbi:unnamed protein product [Trifolium pratense]|uniref:Uncharacterized protein n=1 Tax=Trifolium pratense TaxID=57577 RepID=A0ACB0KTC8_TRIPR|nr:unnamed protein product [Trifolium pratense]
MCNIKREESLLKKIKREENMVAIYKLIYAMFLFLSLILIIMNVDAFSGCISDFDCESAECCANCGMICLNNRCQCIKIH